MQHLSSVYRSAPQNILSAIETASTKTGVNFDYLVKQAQTESSFNTTAKAKTSSARGLYQFLDATWMDVISKHGAKHGINTNQSKQTLLKLRNDPKTASLMAAEFASDNKKVMENKWGGDIGATEQYLAHFMGASGASAFLNARDENPLGKAAYIFPKAARANRSIFYDTKTGVPKSFEEIHTHFDKKFNTNEEKPRSVVFKNQNTPKATPKETIAWNDNPIPPIWQKIAFNPADILLIYKTA